MRRLSHSLKVLSLSLCTLLFACTSVPDGIHPVKDFELKPYLGKWYEIARLDHGFEEGLSKVTATYAMRDDGGVSVINRGYNTKKGEWEEAEGKAYFVKESTVGHLKVSFFGPFYASYVIFELADENDYAFVTGNNRDYLWLLSRTPTIDEDLKSRFKKQAEALNFDLSELIWVDQAL